ncbi:type IV pilin-like G/H family protein [Microcoleus sp. FACHB-831]|uniref:type IV pilin-like G/H family protein n=1 Tax=Microcoleus sp. FACHB-831 TaxID=2692827 RepID=UPI0028153424|nr:type IV pilin-like G/H family protein [Microcoleus sp. FACHB-831]
MNNQTKSFTYSTHTTGKVAFNYGISRKDNLKSYVGAVFLVKVPSEIDRNAANKEMTPIAIMCEADSRGTTRPADPIYNNGEPACGSGTKMMK